MDIKEKARTQWNGLERVLHMIPGFKGYFAREFRRDSDRLQREFIVKQLRQVKSGMNKVIQAASRRKDFDLLREHDQFVKALDKSMGTCRYADQGYSGFFDLVKVREAELDKVYDLDALLLEAAGSLGEEFKNLAADPLEPSRLTPLRERLEQIADILEQRIALLKGYEKGESE